MNDRSNDDVRRLMIVSDRAVPLDAEEEADLALLADLLADPSTWVEPRAGLEDDVVGAVTGTGVVSVPPSTNPRLGRRLMFMALAAAAALTIVVGSVVVARRSSSPEYRARLDATGLVPEARGEAEISHNNAGFRIVLYTHGLPRLAAGEYYEAWVTAPGEGHIPVGTFSSSDGRVTLWSGESPKDARLTVTIESTDDNQLPSTRRVLSGAVQPG
jgi:hypothetical protein